MDKTSQEAQIEEMKAQIEAVQAEITRLEAAKKRELKRSGKPPSLPSKSIHAKIDAKIAQHKKIKVIAELDWEKAKRKMHPKSPVHEISKEDEEEISELKVAFLPKTRNILDIKKISKPQKSQGLRPMENKTQSAHYSKPLMNGIYYFLANFATRRQKTSLREKLSFAGIDQEAEIYLGQILLLMKLCAIATFMVFWVLFKEASIFILIFYGMLGGLAVLLSAYVLLNVQIEDRKRRLEELLPEAMQVIAANIRAGMTPVVALRAAARPEFGPLSEEIKFATTKSLGTDSFIDALREMGEKTNSELFQRIVSLFTASLRSGGHLAVLLENTAADISQTHELKRDLIASTRMYGLFILLTVALGTPLLLAISIQFSGMVTGLQAKTSSGGLAGELSAGPLISTPLSIDFLGGSALVILIATSILSSALLGVINNGTYSSGLKYAPFICLFSLLAFFFLKDFALKAILPVG